MSLQALQNINSRGRIVGADKGLHIGRVRNLTEADYSPKDIKEYYIPAKDRTKHLGCIGATQMGKSCLISYMIDQDIKAGLNIVETDPKGDIKLTSRIIQSSAEAGRLEDLMFVNPIFPETSLKIDPLAYYYIHDEIVDHVTSGIKAKDEYFINVASEITTAIVDGLIALENAKGNKNVKLNFLDIKNWATYMSLKQLRENLDYLKNHRDPEIRSAAEETIMNIEQILASPVDFFAKVASSLRTTLTALSSGTTGKIIGKAKTNEFIKRLEEGRKVILVCNTGSMLTRRTAYTIGRVLISMIQSLIGRFYASGKKITPALSIYMDEGHNVLYRGIQELFNKSGSADVYLQFFVQSLSQMIEEIGEDATQSIVDNIHQWIYMHVNHEKTAEFVENSTPIKTMQEPFLSMAGGKISMSLRGAERRLILKEKLLSLPPRWFYMKDASGEFYKGKVADVGDPYVELQMPDTNVTAS